MQIVRSAHPDGAFKELLQSCARFRTMYRLFTGWRLASTFVAQQTPNFRPSSGTYIELMKISAIIFLYSGLSIVKAHQLHTAAALYRILTCFLFKQPNNYQLNYN